MPINIYSVRNHLEENNWKLLSDSYKNLNTELEMECPKGHKQLQTYGNWRKHIICQQCMAGNGTKIQKNKVPIKKIDTGRRILALDAATGITGFAIYDDEALVGYGIHKANRDLDSQARINEVKKWVVDLLRNGEIDFVGIEDIQLQGHNGFQNVETFKTLAKLQGVLLDTFFEECVDHDTVYSSAWRKYCGISQGARDRENKKKAAQEKVRLWYGQNCTQDEADAICIGKYFVHLLKSNKESNNWGEDI